MSTYQDDYESIINEYVDLSDRETLHYVASLDEADQNQLLLSLTDKLYDKIVEKVDNIDFGSIPNSKGDITQIENYDSMVDCINIIREIVKQYKQPTEPLDQIETAINNIKDRERLFSRCYTMNVELGIVIYNTMVLSIVSSLSYMISSSIDFITSPTDNVFQTSLDRVGYNKSSQSMMFNDLRKFNIACKNGDLDKSLELILGQRGARAMTGDTVKKVIGGIAIGYVAAKAVLIPLSKNILPLIQNLVYIHYANRQSVSDYFAIQADLIQANTANIEYREDLSDDKKKKIIDKQNKIADRMRKISNKLHIRIKGAEIDADKLAKSEYKKYQKEELASSSNGLF